MAIDKLCKLVNLWTDEWTATVFFNKPLNRHEKHRWLVQTLSNLRVGPSKNGVTFVAVVGKGFSEGKYVAMEAN